MGRGIWVIAMTHHLERIDWMPSPPLVPDDGPIDFDHLGRMTLGDALLEHEVLAMFSAQAVGLMRALATLPTDAGALAHKLKGSARAIGAFKVADAAGRLETAITKNSDDLPEALAELQDAVAQARTAIDAILRRS
jgi:HPt (histidine-containing phosphotransfer) domain-containing protein